MLEGLNRECLAEARCWFAGGTRIVLALGEYRESADVDVSAAITVAESAYGTSTRRDLAFALDRFAGASTRRRSLAALAIDDEKRLDLGLAWLASFLGNTAVD